MVDGCPCTKCRREREQNAVFGGRVVLGALLAAVGLCILVVLWKVLIKGLAQ